MEATWWPEEFCFVCVAPEESRNEGGREGVKREREKERERERERDSHTINVCMKTSNS